MPLLKSVYSRGRSPKLAVDDAWLTCASATAAGLSTTPSTKRP